MESVESSVDLGSHSNQPEFNDNPTKKFKIDG